MDGCPAGGEVVELGEFLLRGGQADLESFGFAVPALAFSLGDAGQQVAANVFQPRPPGEVDPEERTPEAAVLMDTASSPGPAAVAACDLAALEVAEELGPFLIGRGAVLLGRPH